MHQLVQPVPYTCYLCWRQGRGEPAKSDASGLVRSVLDKSQECGRFFRLAEDLCWFDGRTRTLTVDGSRGRTKVGLHSWSCAVGLAQAHSQPVAHDGDWQGNPPHRGGP